MGKKNYSSLGEDIKDIVKDALSSAEFNELNKKIRGTVNSALDEVKRSIRESQTQYNKNEKHGKYEDGRNRQEEPFVVEAEIIEEKVTQPMVKKARNKLITPSPTGKISGVVFKVLGITGMSLSAMIIGISIVGLSFEHGLLMATGITAGVFLPVFILSMISYFNGKKLRNRFKRFRQYVKTLGSDDYCEVKVLADSVGKTPKFVIKDVVKMIHMRMFPEGRVSEEKKYFILSDKAYTEYLKLEENKRLLKENEEREEQKRIEREVREALNPELRELSVVIEDGKNTILQIREANDAILDEGISQKLDRLEMIICKIFSYIEVHPEEVSEIRKFMGYYLPTTLKLVNAYRDLDAEPIKGDNIKMAKKEIEGTLDTINKAFENLLDSFFEDTALDISTDISVLQTMLAQEGLTEKDFKNGGN